MNAKAVQHGEVPQERVAMLHDESDMKEVEYGPCNQCQATLSRPLRLFRYEQPLPYINCHVCHSGMSKSVQEQVAYGLGMPLITPPESLIEGAGSIPAAVGNGDSERS